MGEQGDGDATEAILVGVRHRLRREILKQLGVGRSASRSSPRELSEAIREPLSNISYHVRVLADCELIELVDTRHVRGSLQHFYEATERANHPVARASLGLREPQPGDD